MTGLRKWRRVAKKFILFSFAGEIAVTMVSLAFLMFVLVRGGVPTSGSLISILGDLGFYGILIWAILDSSKRSRATPLE